MRRRIVESWNRFYDPSTGRYISADPIGLAGGMNLYAYVGGNPVNWVDIDGLRYSPREHGGQYDGTIGGYLGSVHVDWDALFNVGNEYYRIEARKRAWEAYKLRRELEKLAVKQGGEFTYCVTYCMAKKFPDISTSVAIAAMFEIGLVASGVGTPEVIAFQIVSGSGTTFDVYKGLKDCANECNKCEY